MQSIKTQYIFAFGCIRIPFHIPTNNYLFKVTIQKCQKQGVKEGHRPQYGDFIANSQRLYPQRPHR